MEMYGSTVPKIDNHSKGWTLALGGGYEKVEMILFLQIRISDPQIL